MLYASILGEQRVFLQRPICHIPGEQRMFLQRHVDTGRVLVGLILKSMHGG